MIGEKNEDMAWPYDLPKEALPILEEFGWDIIRGNDCAMLVDIDRYDANGEYIFYYSKKWTQNLINDSLNLLATAYRKGVKHGEQSKAKEIRKALEIF